MEEVRKKEKKAALFTFLIAVLLVVTGSINTLAARLANLVRFESAECTAMFDWPPHDRASEVGASESSDWKPTYVWPNNAMCPGGPPEDPPMSGTLSLDGITVMAWQRFEPDISKEGIESDGKSLPINFKLRLHPGEWVAIAWCQCGGEPREDTRPYQCENVQTCDLEGGDVFVGFVTRNKTCGTMDLTIQADGSVVKDTDNGCTDDVSMPFAGCPETPDGGISLFLQRHAETQDFKCDQRLPVHGFYAYATGVCTSELCGPQTKAHFTRRSDRVYLLPEDAYGTVCSEEDVRCAFNHPFFQADLMFFGQFLNLLVYFVLCKVHAPGTEGHPGCPGPNFKAYLFALPAFCDLIATGMMYVGLTLIYSSIFQMLRGSIIIFTMMFSFFFFGRRPHTFQCVAVMFIIVGLGIVGLAAFIGQGGGCGASSDAGKTFLGCIVILAAQISQAFQFVIEEKFLGEHNVPPLLAVGLEGVFGMFFVTAIMIPMHWIPSPFTRSGVRSWPTHYLEDMPSAFSQISCNPVVVLPLLGTATSIAFFNFAGVTITKRLSATVRIVLDSVRTVVIWGVSMLLQPAIPGMQGFDKLTFGWQAFGFVVLLTGIALYERVLTYAGGEGDHADVESLYHGAAVADAGHDLHEMNTQVDSHAGGVAPGDQHAEPTSGGENQHAKATSGRRWSSCPLVIAPF
eukprot:Hpha_TRINITY_DN12992_c0_g1::TRINITY_DN12992_c0_g1_i1::g.164441::m.164441